jgi:hypothetical protein
MEKESSRAVLTLSPDSVPEEVSARSEDQGIGVVPGDGASMAMRGSYSDGSLDRDGA